ncbi:MAG: OmpH family outer membrane protein [Vicinamibacteria bacterium]|nr:OmpH family outer membrane protein [Vicinamibacteria bacterium]
MKRNLTLIRQTTMIAAALLIPALSGAQEPGQAASTPKIGVVDVERVYADSLLGKSYASKLEGLENDIKAETGKKQAEVDKLNKEISAANEDYQKQKNVLSEDALSEKEKEILSKTRARDALVEDGRRDLERMQRSAQQQAQVYMNEFQVKLRPHIDAVTKARGIDLLLDRRVVFHASDPYDISGDVIARADESMSGAEKDKPAGAAAKP